MRNKFEKSVLLPSKGKAAAKCNLQTHYCFRAIIQQVRHNWQHQEDHQSKYNLVTITLSERILKNEIKIFGDACINNFNL